MVEVVQYVGHSNEGPKKKKTRVCIISVFLVGYLSTLETGIFSELNRPT